MSDEPTWRFRQRPCFLTRKDLADFTEVIRTRYPDLYIYEYSLSLKFCRELEHFGQAKLELEFSPTRPDPPPEVGRCESMARSIPCLVNTPDIFVELFTSNIQTVDLRETGGSYGIRPANAVIRRLYFDGLLRGQWLTDDPARKKFVQAVFRLSTRFMTNAANIVDVETGKVLKTMHGLNWWAGPDAMRMGEEEPDFYCYIYFDREFDRWVGGKAIPRPSKTGKT